MAETIDLLDVMQADEPAKPSGAAPSRGRSKKRTRDEGVVAIQNLLIQHGLPVGKKNPKTADGVYGEVTHDSLKRFVNATHTDAQVKSKAAAIKPLMTETWNEMLPKLKDVASVIGSERALPSAPGQQPAEQKEQFDITIEVDGKQKKFPLMAAIRSPGHLLYILELYGMYDRNASPEERRKQIIKANQDIRKFIPQDWVGALTVFDEYNMFLANKVIQESNKKQMGQLIDWLDARFNTIMPNIPRDMYPRITRYVYSLDPRMVSSPNLDAEITDLKRLRTYTAPIHHQLVLMMRQAPMQVRRPKAPQRKPNVLKQVYPGAKPQVSPAAPFVPNEPMVSTTKPPTTITPGVAAPFVTNTPAISVKR